MLLLCYTFGFGGHGAFYCSLKTENIQRFLKNLFGFHVNSLVLCFKYNALHLNIRQFKHTTWKLCEKPSYFPTKFSKFLRIFFISPLTFL